MARANEKATDVALKLTVERDRLQRGLAHAAAVVERRNIIPILANVLIEATVAGPDGSIRLTASDLDVQITLDVEAQVEAVGAITVPAHLLNDIVRELQAGSQVELEYVDGKLNVSSGRSRYKLQTLPRTDFPTIQPDAEATRYALQAAQMLRMIARTSFAISDEQHRDYLHGIRLSVIDGKLIAAATNGHCLAEASCPAPDGADAPPPATLSTKYVGELRKLLDGRDGAIDLAIGPRLVEARVGEAVLTGKLVEGNFPDWRRVIPTANDKKMLLHADAFCGAIRRARVVANEKTRAVRLDLSRDKLTVSVSSPENGTATEEAPASYEGGELTIGFNSTYLLDTAAAIGCDELQIDFADDRAPTLFTNPNDSSALWVVMPMRV